MKIRLAKKIMRQQIENDLPHHKTSLYWLCAWGEYNIYITPSFIRGKADHRIDKAISLTSKFSKKHGK